MGGLQVDDNLIGISGGTDGTTIGNVSDRLKTQNLPAQYAPDLTTTGSLTALNSTVSTSVLDGMGTAGILIAGTWVGTVTFQISVDGSTWVTTNVVPVGATTIVTSTTSNGSFRVNIGGMKAVRVLMSAYTSGTASITIQCTSSAGFIRTASFISGGTDGTTIGNVSDAIKTSGSVTVTTGNNQYYLGLNQMFGCASDASAATAGTDNPVLLIKNPSGSGKIIYVVKLIAGCTVTNIGVRFNIYADPTITSNGTTLTNYQRNVGNSPANGVATTFTLPTLSALGNKIDGYSHGQNNNGINFSAEYTIGIQPNHSIVLTADPFSNNRNVMFSAVWVEV